VHACNPSYLEVELERITEGSLGKSY
jgi:hypothetical protein